MTKREFAFACIPGLEQDLEGAKAALDTADVLSGEYGKRLKGAFVDEGIEGEFVAWCESRQMTTLPEDVRRELFLLTHRK